MKIINKKIDDLKPYKLNAKLHPEKQIDGIAESIRRFGFTQPIVIDKNNEIIIGHGRHAAATKAGLKEVPCVMMDGLNENEVKALRLIDNRIAETGWDIEILNVDIEALDFNFEPFGIDFDNLKIEAIPKEGLTDPDSVPEAPKEPKTKIGDIYKLGDHRLMCGDATNIQHVEKLIDGNKIDMVFTDPPYGIGFDKENQKIGKSQYYGAVLNDHDNQVAIDSFNLVIGLNIPIVYFWGANYYSNILPSSSCWIVWDKQDGKHVTYADVELCYTNHKSPSRKFKHIWDGFRKDSEKGENRVHPTQKPIELIKEIWDFFKDDCKTVIDLFGGSGSTLIACEKTSRHCLVMELSEIFCDVIIKRWEDFTGKKAELIDA